MTALAKLTQAEIERHAGDAEAIRAHARTAGEAIVATGQILAKVKADLGHGRFLAWIDQELAMTYRTAQRYMAAADWTEGKCDTVSHLEPSVLYLLASPSTPPEVEADVIAKVEAGKPVKAAEVRQQIKAAKVATNGTPLIQTLKVPDDYTQASQPTPDLRKFVEAMAIGVRQKDKDVKKLARFQSLIRETWIMTRHLEEVVDAPSFPRLMAQLAEDEKDPDFVGLHQEMIEGLNSAKKLINKTLKAITDRRESDE